METNRGVLIVLSGFSGAGKGTVVKALLEKYDNYAISVSATTRPPREGEVDGVHYFFKTKEEFEEMIERDALLEHACYVDNYYGTPKEYVEQQLDSGKDVILEIEIQGAMDIKKKFPDTVLMFITAPDADTLRERLTGRGTETTEVINARLKRAYEESVGIEDYDYFIVNDTVEDCVERVNAIIKSEHARTIRNKNNIDAIREQLKAFAKGE